MSSPAAPPPMPPRARLRWSLVRRAVADLAPKTILEIGCGMGAAGVRLAAMAPYTAVEPDDRSWAVAHERITPLGGVVVHGDHNKVPPGSYDLVCAFEVLEHIADDRAALADWVPLIRPGGHLMMSVPAHPERFGPMDVSAGHFRRYTVEDLRERLAEAGAVDIDIKLYGWPLGYALEAVRNRIVGREGVASEDESVVQARTSASGRLFQPRSWLAGAAINAGVAPFLVLQRLRPSVGTGLFCVARRPE
jgi:SAM-dependent methyltransferase